MAIDIHIFQNTGRDQNRLEVKAWLEENATDLFPGGIEINDVQDGSYTTRGLKLYPIENAENALFYLGYKGGQYDNHSTKIVAQNGTTLGTFSTPAYYKKAAKAGSAVALMDSFGATYIFTKDTSNKTCAFAVLRSSNGTPPYQMICTDFVETAYPAGTVSMQKIGTGTTIAELKDTLVTRDAPKTLLMPVVFGGGGVSEDVFITYFSQVTIDTEWMRVNMDGSDYLYDGLSAMKG